MTKKYLIKLSLLLFVIVFSNMSGCSNNKQESSEKIDTYKELKTIKKLKPIPKKYISPIDFEKLSKTNPDIIGWVKIPNTNIDYPIVQTTNNDKYLNIDFEGKPSIKGTIFLDYESESDFKSWNNILYGHNMKDGSMFTDINRFKNKDYFNKHREVIIYTPTKAIKLKTIAAFYGDANVIARKTDFESAEELKKFVAERIKRCSYADMPKESISTVYTFVTCSYEIDNARTFLYAIPKAG